MDLTSFGVKNRTLKLVFCLNMEAPSEPTSSAPFVFVFSVCKQVWNIFRLAPTTKTTTTWATTVCNAVPSTAFPALLLFRRQFQKNRRRRRRGHRHAIFYCSCCRCTFPLFVVVGENYEILWRGKQNKLPMGYQQQQQLQGYLTVVYRL